jgi:hypothetical protein
MTRKVFVLFLLIATGCSTEAGIRAGLSDAMAASQIREHSGSEFDASACDTLPDLVIVIPGEWVSEAKLAELFDRQRDPRTTDAAIGGVLILDEGGHGVKNEVGKKVVEFFLKERPNTSINALVRQWHCPVLETADGK